MKSEHKAPLIAFILVSVACAGVLLNALRTESVSNVLLAPAQSIVAGTEMVPGAGNLLRAEAHIIAAVAPPPSPAQSPSPSAQASHVAAARSSGSSSSSTAADATRATRHHVPGRAGGATSKQVNASAGTPSGSGGAATMTLAHGPAASTRGKPQPHRPATPSGQPHGKPAPPHGTPVPPHGTPVPPHGPSAQPHGNGAHASAPSSGTSPATTPSPTAPGNAGGHGNGNGNGNGNAGEHGRNGQAKGHDAAHGHGRRAAARR